MQFATCSADGGIISRLHNIKKKPNSLWCIDFAYLRNISTYGIEQNGMQIVQMSFFFKLIDQNVAGACACVCVTLRFEIYCK